MCVPVRPGTKESGGSSVAGREQINPHRARMLPHSPRHGGTEVCVCGCVSVCVYKLEKDSTNKWDNAEDVTNEITEVKG